MGNHLEKLWLDNNKITNLPNELPKMLQGLTIDDNPLISLSSGILDLKNLSMLSMFYTIKEFDPIISELETNGVQVDQNCLDDEDINFDEDIDFEDFND